MKYLYHYTNLETLALILNNKTICFNNLLNVDDVEEAETNDMGKFGRFIYVSCWTEDDEESIPLWNLYTHNMHGVRIRMPEFPFKKYRYKKGDYFLSEEVETYINIKKVYDENRAGIVADQPHLIKVEYTNDNEKLFPKIKSESCQGAIKNYLEAKSMKDIKEKELKISYSFKDMGKYKRENWNFQQEWRYIISLSPMGLQDANPPSFEKHQEMIRRIEDKDLEPPYKQIFLELDEDVLNGMEIVFGPRMSEAEKIIVKALMKQFCPYASYRDSSLRIK